MNYYWVIGLVLFAVYAAANVGIFVLQLKLQNGRKALNRAATEAWKLQKIERWFEYEIKSSIPLEMHQKVYKQNVRLKLRDNQNTIEMLDKVAAGECSLVYKDRTISVRDKEDETLSDA